jgi:hypothetical protein
MAEFQDRQEQIGTGKRWVETMCGRSHNISEVHWNEQEDTAQLHYWLTLPPRQRKAVRLSFTLQELSDCATNLNVRGQLMRRIQEALTPWLEPREAQDF